LLGVGVKGKKIGETKKEELTLRGGGGGDTLIHKGKEPIFRSAEH